MLECFSSILCKEVEEISLSVRNARDYFFYTFIHVVKSFITSTHSPLAHDGKLLSWLSEMFRIAHIMSFLSIPSTSPSTIDLSVVLLTSVICQKYLNKLLFVIMSLFWYLVLLIHFASSTVRSIWYKWLILLATSLLMVHIPVRIKVGPRIFCTCNVKCKELDLLNYQHWKTGVSPVPKYIFSTVSAIGILKYFHICRTFIILISRPASLIVHRSLEHWKRLRY